MADPSPDALGPPPIDALTALACAALADGQSLLTGVAFTADLGAALDALNALGVRVDADRGGGVIGVTGCGGHTRAGDATLPFGRHPGAMAAVLCVLAVGHGQFTLTGSGAADLSALCEALRDLGAWIGGEEPARLHLDARGLGGGELVLGPGAGPFAPMLLAALPYARADVLIEFAPASPAAVEPTLRLLLAFGVETIAGGERASRLVIPAPQRYRGTKIAVNLADWPK